MHNSVPGTRSRPVVGEERRPAAIVVGWVVIANGYGAVAASQDGFVMLSRVEMEFVAVAVGH